MPTAAELKEEFWKALKSDMTLMLGLADADNAHMRPMTAQCDGSHGPLWFFSSKDTELAKKVRRNHRAIASFTAKNHAVFATLHGTLSIDNDPEMIDKYWNRYVEAWYEEGKDDPKLVLLRMDLEEAEIWENASSLMAGIKTLFGSDPKVDYKDKVAKVKMR
jgi:general stress protein 26